MLLSFTYLCIFCSVRLVLIPDDYIWHIFYIKYLLWMEIMVQWQQEREKEIIYSLWIREGWNQTCLVGEGWEQRMKSPLLDWHTLIATLSYRNTNRLCLSCQGPKPVSVRTGLHDQNTEREGGWGSNKKNQKKNVSLLMHEEEKKPKKAMGWWREWGETEMSASECGNKLEPIEYQARKAAPVSALQVW